MARRKFRSMSEREVEARCDAPRWKPTKRGKRCTRICRDEEGREQWRFVSGEECGGGGGRSRRAQSEEVAEFTSGFSELEPLEPLDLGDSPRRRRGRRR